MSGLVLTVIIVAAVVVLGGLALTAWQSRRRRSLRDRFGPEYDHAVDNAENRRTAEKDLRERAAQRDELEIRDLTPAAAARYQEQWLLVQQQFVDEPIPAVRDAQTLVTRVMNDRGYPTSTAKMRESMLSVDHADVMDNYRTATEIEARSSAGNATTEELRQAMQKYRAMFERLLGSSASNGRDPYPSGSMTNSTSSTGDVTLMRGNPTGPVE